MRKLLMVLSGLLVLSGCSGVDTIFKNDVSKDPVQDKKATKKVVVQCDHGEDIKTTFEASDDNILQMKQYRPRGVSGRINVSDNNLKG